eukprot:11211170-Lingulodinium_polyedra.AAC.1
MRAAAEVGKYLAWRAGRTPAEIQSFILVLKLVPEDGRHAVEARRPEWPNPGRGSLDGRHQAGVGRPRGA